MRSSGSAKDQKLYALNTGGWAPAGWTPRFFTETLGVKRVPGSGVNSATVPGAVAGYDALLKRFGTVTFKEAFERAARIADEGWGQAERRHDDLRGAVNGLRADPDSRQTFLVNDQVPDLYSIIRNPALANALRTLQTQGRDGFYRGDIAAAIVAKVRAGGGVMTAADLAEFESEWVEPISTNYHGYDVYELPPPGQGFAALEMLNILEVCVPKLGASLATLGPSNPMYWHLMVEAKKLAYTNLLARNADPHFAEVPVSDLCRSLTRRRCATRSIRTWPRSPERPALPTAARSISRLPTAGATWCRSSTACSASTAAARPSRPTASCCTTAARRSRSTRRARTSWRRANARSTPSSPAS